MIESGKINDVLQSEYLVNAMHDKLDQCIIRNNVWELVEKPNNICHRN